MITSLNLPTVEWHPKLFHFEENLHPSLSHPNRRSRSIFKHVMSDRPVTGRWQNKDANSAFVHLNTFTEQSHLAACWQRHQSVCPTLRLEQQF